MWLRMPSPHQHCWMMQEIPQRSRHQMLLDKRMLSFDTVYQLSGLLSTLHDIRNSLGMLVLKRRHCANMPL